MSTKVFPIQKGQEPESGDLVVVDPKSGKAKKAAPTTEVILQLKNTTRETIRPKSPCFIRPRKGGIRPGTWKEIVSNSKLFAGVSERKITPGQKGPVLVKGIPKPD